MKRKEEPKPAPAPTTKVCPKCFTEISIKATRCPNCTSELSA
jgi:large conductance mechanosensitive channel